MSRCVVVGLVLVSSGFEALLREDEDAFKHRRPPKIRFSDCSRDSSSSMSAQSISQRADMRDPLPFAS